MKIAEKIRDVLSDGKQYTIGQIWQLVNGAEIEHKIVSNAEKANRLKKISEKNRTEFISYTQVERSVKGLHRRGSLALDCVYNKVVISGKEYRLRIPVKMYCLKLKSLGRCLWEDNDKNCGHCEYYSHEEEKCKA
jgi:hypothetical protein